MADIPDFSPVAHQEIPEGRHGAVRQIALVGLNRATAELLPNLLDADGIQVVKVLNPDFEDLSRLTIYPHLDVIIDTTRNPSIAGRLRKLPLKKVDVISGLGARLLICAVREGQGDARDSAARALDEIRGAAGQTKDKRVMLQAVLNAAVKTSRADSGSLMLLDPSRRQLTIEAACGLDESVVVSSIQRVGQGVSGYVVRHREPVIINGAADRETYATEYQKPELVSSICCPLSCGGEVLGVINLSSRNPSRVFGKEDVEALEELARVAAETVQSGREGDAPAGQAHGQAHGLVNSVREILAMRYRFEERLNLLLMKMANSFGALACTYYEFNSVERTFVAKASSSVAGNLLKDRSLRLDDLFAQRLLKTPVGFCVNSAGKGPRAKKWHLLQPIRSGTELAGALFVYLQSERNHFKDEMVLLKRIGDMLAREAIKHRELESIKAQSLKYSAIAQFASDAARAKDLPELARMILSNLRMMIDADTSILRLCSGSGGYPEVAQTLTQRDAVWLKDILAVDKRLTLSIAVSGEPARIDKLSDSEYASEILASEGAMGAPLSLDGETLGTLTLYDKRSPDPSGPKRFTEEDQDVLAQFAGQAVKALARFRPFPEAIPTASEPALAGP
jgi:GAF domain-containing protein